MKPHCPPSHDLEQLMLGLLPEDTSLPLEDHLLECPGCQTTVAGMTSGDTVVAALRKSPVDEPLPPCRHW